LKPARSQQALAARERTLFNQRIVWSYPRYWRHHRRHDDDD